MPSRSLTSSPISLRTRRMPAKSWPPPSLPCPPSASASAAQRSPTPSSPTASSCPPARARNWTSSLASTSCNEQAAELLAICLKGERRPGALLDRLTAPDCADSLFRVVVERLADLFDPRHCDTYADLFSEVIAGSLPDLKAADLRARYDRVRWPRKFQGDVKNVETVFVLSRVTLGADVAVTSVLMDAARRRFPK